MIDQLYLSSLSFYAVLAPGLVLMLLPMKNCLKSSGIIPKTALFLCLVIPSAAFADTFFHLPYNALSIPLLILCFFFFKSQHKAHLSKSLSVFLLVTALLVLISDYALGLDAFLHPQLTRNDMTPEACLFQLFLGLFMLALFAFPLYRYGSRLIDRFHVYRAWYVTLLLELIPIFIADFFSPHFYVTLHVNRVALAYWVTLLLLFGWLLILCVLFYFVVSGMLEAAELQEKNRLYELQEDQYQAFLEHAAETERLRHDLKHTINTISTLANAGDLPALREYLKEYTDSIPETVVRHFCENNALNALLNHFYHRALAGGIETTMTIFLSGELSAMEVELCSVLGNLMENAIRACGEVPAGERFIGLSIEGEGGGKIFIICTNSFSGEVRQKDGVYLSSRKRGGGIGLNSISEIARFHNGIARFSHEGKEFHADIMLDAGD